MFLRWARGVLKVALNEKQENTTMGFRLYIMWLFEAFLKTMNLISHPEFLISEIKDLNRNQKIYFKSYAKEEARFSNYQRQSSFVIFKVLGIISRIKLADCSI